MIAVFSAPDAEVAAAVIALVGVLAGLWVQNRRVHRENRYDHLANTRKIDQLLAKHDELATDVREVKAEVRDIRADQRSTNDIVRRLGDGQRRLEDEVDAIHRHDHKESA